MLGQDLETSRRDFILNLPRSSCHSPCTFLSICFGEALRVFRRCTSKQAFRGEIKFLTGKLVAKGQSNREISQGVSNAFLASRSRNGPSKSTKRQVFLKLKHSSSVNYDLLHKMLCKFQHMHGHEIVIARSVQHSLFLLLYPTMWPNKQLAVGGQWSFVFSISLATQASVCCFFDQSGNTSIRVLLFLALPMYIFLS